MLQHKRIHCQRQTAFDQPVTRYVCCFQPTIFDMPSLKPCLMLIQSREVRVRHVQHSSVALEMPISRYHVQICSFSIRQIFCWSIAAIFLTQAASSPDTSRDQSASASAASTGPATRNPNVKQTIGRAFENVVMAGPERGEQTDEDPTQVSGFGWIQAQKVRHASSHTNARVRRPYVEKRTAFCDVGDVNMPPCPALRRY